MAKDIQITKILLLRGESQDLPRALDTAEVAYTQDQGRLFFGLPEGFRGPAEGREVFPYENTEILTENSTELFARLHGDLLKRAGNDDYYNCVLPPSDEWRSVQVRKTANEFVDYEIQDIDSVTAFIDYAAYFADGTFLRMGDMTLRHFVDNPAEPLLEDSRSSERQAIDADPLELRFVVSGPLNAPFLVFQYRNPHTQPVIFRFKVSRPTPTFFERKSGNDNVGRILGRVVIGSQSVGAAFLDATGFIDSSLPIGSNISGTGEIIVFEGWYARARIRLINPSTTMEGGDLQIRPITTGLPFNDVSLSGSGTGNLFYGDGTPQRIYDADGFGVTLYWTDPRVMFVTEARLRLQFSGVVSPDMRATFGFQRWDQGSATLTQTRAPITSQVINPSVQSWSSGNEFPVRRLFQDTWYFNISI